MISFVIGLFVGSFIGVALMALMYMAKDYEPKKREPERKEPTIMWMVGNLCKWRGKIFEICGFESFESYNQTFALLKSDDGSKAAVLVEELEAVEE